MYRNKVKEVREGLGITQVRLGFLAKMPSSNVSNIERGVWKPWPKAKRAIARALRRKVEDLFPDDSQK